MRFTKMHGAGNDYIYVDGFTQPAPREPAALARAMSDRHTGVGGDGLILILPSDVADARMRMFNADGSEAEMCGNGIRCVAKYVYDNWIARQPGLKIETARGVLSLDLHTNRGRVEQVRVNMGRPILKAAEIPTRLTGEPPVEVELVVPGGGGSLRESRVCSRSEQTTLKATCVSMGNPHCVLFVDGLSDEMVRGLGPQIERHAAFPARTNVEFAQVVSPRELRMRVWERGAGETLACGTGACAAVVAGVLSGRTERRVACQLPGGHLDVEWAASGDVFLTGPAVEVFSGEWNASTRGAERRGIAA